MILDKEGMLTSIKKAINLYYYSPVPTKISIVSENHNNLISNFLD